MFRVRRRGRPLALGGGLLALLLVAGPAPAQETPPAPEQDETPPVPAREAERRLLEHIDTLLPLLEEARAAVAEEDAREKARRQASHPSETVRVGPFLVIAAEGEAVREAARSYDELWRRWSGMVGDATSELDGTVLVYRTGPSDSTVVSPPPRGRVYNIVIRSWYPPDRRRELILWSLEQTLRRVLPPEVLEWSRGLRLEPQEEDEVYRRLVTTPSRAARECYEGETEACWEALGVSEEASPLERWYTDTEARALALRSGSTTEPLAQQRRRIACARGDLESCWAFLHARPVSVWIPLPPMARQHLLAFALEAGGEGAFARLIEGEGVRVDRRLAAAAAMSPPELIEAWRAAVIDAAPDRSAALGLGPVAALFWITLLSGLSLRSTRWRVG